jgi:hypothetical protein
MLFLNKSIKMKKLLLPMITLTLFAGLLSLSSCNTSSSTTLPGSWDQLGDFDGVTRSGAVGFVIGNYAYLGTGYNFDVPERLTDFWRYDPQIDTWIQMADFPGLPRSNAVGFSLNGKGYIGTGLGGTDINNPVPLGDFWQFDPTTGPKGSWTRIADFGTPTAYDTALIRYGALAFSVNNRGFVGGGYYLAGLKDFWEYDQPNNQWIQRPSIGGSKRQNGFVFVNQEGSQEYAYVGGGNDNGTYVVNFFRFDSSLLSDTTQNPWFELNGLTGKDKNGNAIVQPKPRELACAWSISGLGYLSCGSTGAPQSDTWQYTPPIINSSGVITTGDTWIQYFSFANNTPTVGSARDSGVGFAIGLFGHITTGKNGSRRLDDSWLFNPVGVEPDNK